MENIVLTIHLILALGLIGSVLLQRSEGGGLGIGGGGGGAMSGRSAATAMAKVTWILAIGFLITSLTLTVIAAKNAGGSSVLDLQGSATSTPVEDIPLADPNAILIPDLGNLTIGGTDAEAAAPVNTQGAPATPPASE
ncbi:MAG: preprotein translocase subunit SecG [Rhodobacteraceae bacterium]|nr:preprotein translocase subunit SecG [Paracoccaceae bacterium]